jgi:hypothetical protein
MAIHLAHMPHGVSESCHPDFLAFFTQFSVVRQRVRDDAFWEKVDVCLRVLTPALVVLRYADGKKGSSMALVYSLMIDLNEFYKKPIRGLSEVIRKKVGATVTVLAIVKPTYLCFFLLARMAHTVFSFLIALQCMCVLRVLSCFLSIS